MAKKPPKVLDLIDDVTVHFPSKQGATYLVNFVELVNQYYKDHNRPFDIDFPKEVQPATVHAIVKKELLKLAVLHLGLNQEQLHISTEDIKKRRLGNFLKASLDFKKCIDVNHKYEKNYFSEVNLGVATNLSEMLDLEITNMIYSRLFSTDVFTTLTKYPKSYFLVTFNTKKNFNKIGKFVKENFVNYIWGTHHIALESSINVHFLKLTYPEDVGSKMISLEKYVEPLQTMIDELGIKFILKSQKDIWYKSISKKKKSKKS